MVRVLFWLFLGALASSCTTLPAGSGVLYSLSLPNGDRVNLHDASSEFCDPVPGAKRATFVYRPEVAKPLVEGCYLIMVHEGQEVVVMAFADGDQAALPLQVFRNGRLPTAARGTRSS